MDGLNYIDVQTTAKHLHADVLLILKHITKIKKSNIHATIAEMKRTDQNLITSKAEDLGLS